MSEQINQFIAKILETFRQKSPTLYAVTFVVLLTAIYFAQQGTLFGLFSVSGFVAKAITWISTILGFLGSSQVFNFLPPAQQAARKTIPETRAIG